MRQFSAILHHINKQNNSTSSKKCKNFNFILTIKQLLVLTMFNFASISPQKQTHRETITYNNLKDSRFYLITTLENEYTRRDVNVNCTIIMYTYR
jgi:hypothetical protein